MSGLQASFARCQIHGCGEYALSFAAQCWEHVSREAYLSDLHLNIQRLPRKPQFAFNLKKVHAADLDFSGIDARGSSFSQAHLSNSSFIGTNLSDADMIGARFNSCDFVGCDIFRANFTRSVLSSSSFSHSDLRGTYFVEAHFRDTDFMSSVLFDCVLWNADFAGARNIKMSNFRNPDSQKARPSFHLSEENTLGAFEAYRSIKHYFYRSGLHEAAGWAAWRELKMEQKYFLEKKDLRFIPSLLMDLLSGYTQKPARVILSSTVIVIVFAAFYYFLNVPVVNPPSITAGSATFWDSLYFSFITFTTVGYGDFIPRPHFWFRFLVCFEAFSGPFMAGLYIFTLTRRYAAG